MKTKPTCLNFIILCVVCGAILFAGIVIGRHSFHKKNNGNDLFVLGWLTGYKRGMLNQADTKEDLLMLLKTDSTDVFNKINQ